MDRRECARPEAKPNDKFGETVVEGGGAKNVVDFTYTPPPAGLPVGEYKVDIYLNSQPGKEEQPAKSVAFSVKSARPMISKATSSASENGSSVTEFPAGTPIFFCTVDLRGASAPELAEDSQVITKVALGLSRSACLPASSRFRSSDIAVVPVG